MGKQNPVLNPTCFMLNLVSYVEQKISEAEDRVFLPYTFPHGSQHKTVDEATSKRLAVSANVPLFAFLSTQ